MELLKDLLLLVWLGGVAGDWQGLMTMFMSESAGWAGLQSRLYDLCLLQERCWLFGLDLEFERDLELRLDLDFPLDFFLGAIAKFYH